MSFSVSVPATKKEEIRNVLYTLEYPQTISTPHAMNLFDAATRAAADLIDSLTGNYEHVIANLSGHAYTGEENSYTKNSVNVSVSEIDPPEGG
jgi:hypothetical protein